MSKKPTLKPELETAIENYIYHLRAGAKVYYKKHLSNLSVPDISVMKGGRKYLRVVVSDTGGGSSRSVHSFIEVETGLIWKAAGWSGPAKNYARGNVLRPETYKDITHYGL